MALIRDNAYELLDSAPDAMIIADASGAIVYVNHQALVLFGFTCAEIIGKRLEILLPERFRRTHTGLRTAYARNPRLRPMGENLELYAQHRDGSEFRVEIRLSALQTDDGLFTTSTIRDVTAREALPLKATLPTQGPRAGAQRAHQEARMAEAREHAQGTLSSISDAVISTDLADNVSYLNPVAERMTGWSRADATGRPLQEVLVIMDDSGRQTGLTSMKAATEQHHVGHRLMDGILTRRDGAELAVEHSQTSMQDDQGENIGAVMVLRDVSVTRATTQKLAYAVQHDALTGLPNRILLESRLTQAFELAARHHQAVAVLFLDLDGFKLVNDTLGHLVGDRLLQSVASLLQRCVRSADTVSRFGGDEFAILLSEISHSADAVIVAQKILGALGMQHVIDQHRVVVTASIGIGLYPDGCTDPHTLLRHADGAMFRAKRHGGNTYQVWN